MKRSLIFSVIGMLFTAPLALASINLNSSRSNVYRMITPAPLVNQPNVVKMLAAMDKLGAVDDATLTKWLRAHFKDYGIDSKRVKKITIVHTNDPKNPISVILLTDPPNQEKAARDLVGKSVGNNMTAKTD
jgi:hypothetical protein